VHSEVEEAATKAQLNEQRLWHGSALSTLLTIINEGFDVRVSNMSGALGAGAFLLLCRLPCAGEHCQRLPSPASALGVQGCATSCARCSAVQVHILLTLPATHTPTHNDREPPRLDLDFLVLVVRWWEETGADDALWCLVVPNVAALLGAAVWAPPCSPD